MAIVASVTYGGAPALGQTFQIFSSDASSGNSAGIVPPPRPGLLWRFDPARGTLSMVSATSQPQLAAAIAGGQFKFKAVNVWPARHECTPGPAWPGRNETERDPARPV